MKHKDHKLLAHYLIELSPERWKNAAKRRAFLVGNILPDFNPVTYLRGVKQSGRMAGHDFPYSEKHTLRVAHRLYKNGVRGILDCYSLGTLVHYLADSFTYPHTENFRDSMKEHNRYERELHSVFPGCVREMEQQQPRTLPEDPERFLHAQRVLYEESPQSMRNDAEHILQVCTAIYGAILKGKC